MNLSFLMYCFLTLCAVGRIFKLLLFYFQSFFFCNRNDHLPSLPKKIFLVISFASFSSRERATRQKPLLEHRHYFVFLHLPEHSSHSSNFRRASCTERWRFSKCTQTHQTVTEHIRYRVTTPAVSVVLGAAGPHSCLTRLRLGRQVTAQCVSLYIQPVPKPSGQKILPS